MGSELTKSASNTDEKHKCNDVKALYDQLCVSYHAIDDFRTKLLGFLPLATLAGAGTLFLKDPGLTVRLCPGPIDSKTLVITPIGIFGFVVTLGLYIFEIHGIAKCHFLIETGKRLEEQLGGAGQFATRPDDWLYSFLNEPIAGAVIYGAVLAAWIFIASMFLSGLLLAGLMGSSVFFVFFGLSVLHEWRLKLESKPNRSTPIQGE